MSFEPLGFQTAKGLVNKYGGRATCQSEGGSEKHQSMGTPVEGVETMLPLTALCSGVSGRWSACGWAVVQLDHDQEMGTNAWDVWNLGCSARDTAHLQEARVDSFLVSL